MSATMMSESVSISGPESQPPPININSNEVEYAKCDICGLVEECTPAYIVRIRERYQGKWVCGLCTEAIKDEIIRSERLITTEEALNRHMNFCMEFNSSSPPRNSTELMISAMKQLLMKSLDSPRVRSTPSSPKKQEQVRRPKFSRSESCIV